MLCHWGWLKGVSQCCNNLSDDHMQTYSQRNTCWNRGRLHSQTPLPLAGTPDQCEWAKCQVSHVVDWSRDIAIIADIVIAGMTVAAPLPLSSPLSLEVLLIGTRGKRIIPSICLLVFPLVVWCFFHHAKMLVRGLSLCSSLAEDKSCSCVPSNEHLW